MTAFGTDHNFFFIIIYSISFLLKQEETHTHTLNETDTRRSSGFEEEKLLSALTRSRRQL